VRTYLLGLGLVVLLGACDTATDPAAEPTISAAKGGRVASATLTSSETTTSSTTTETGTTTGTTTESSTPQVLQFLPGAPPLKTYDTTFAAVQGWKQNHVIFHEDGNYFMVLEVPNSAQFVDADGVPLAYGEPFGLRAVVSQTSVSFEFQPHGSYFTGTRPVVLWVYLKYVDTSAGMPQVWYQSESDDPWVAQETTVDRAGNWLKIDLKHFSNYAVAW
jgi:hypothetical protein